MRPTVDALLRRKKASDASGRTELPEWEGINRLLRRVIRRAWED